MRINYYKLVFIILAGLYGLNCALHVDDYHFLDGVNLLFHEAGHPLFGFFGSEFLMVLGGTLMQLLMPLVILTYFIFIGQRFSASVAGVWFSQNFFGISRYMKDASAMELPLVGNGDRIHDWNYIMDDLGRLGQEGHIGNAVFLTGVVLLIVFVFMGLFFSWEKKELF